MKEKTQVNPALSVLSCMGNVVTENCDSVQGLGIY